MKIAMIASEAAPFVKTGGLGDVMQALPQELSKIRGNEICLFLPYYKRIKQNPAIEVEDVGSFSMELSWRESYVGIFRSTVMAGLSFHCSCSFYFMNIIKSFVITQHIGPYPSRTLLNTIVTITIR